MTDYPLIKTYARSLARPLSQRKKMLMDSKLPQILTLPHIIAKAKAFSNVCLEIGFGNGKHLLTYAQNHPNTLCIGAEPYLNGVAQVLHMLYPDDNGGKLDNILLHPADARQLFIPGLHNLFNQIFILYPDPWPKARHHKKRLINTQFLQNIVKVMAPNAKLDIMTDHNDYAAWIEHAINTCPALSIQLYDITNNPIIASKYESRGLKMNAQLHHFQAVKR